MEEESRRKWLVSINDEDSERLPVVDRYDRIRYLRFEESQRFLADERLNETPHWNKYWRPRNVVNTRSVNPGCFKQDAIAATAEDASRDGKEGTPGLGHNPQDQEVH